jgi:ubiquinone/menaquinone biosynthesis C-methylase UbiE
MSNIRATVKNFFYKAGLVAILDKVLYKVAYLKNKKRNDAFRRENSTLPIPPDYFLYETYRLDYEQFFKDGELTAKEIVDTVRLHSKNNIGKILDWGCGVSRVTMHLHKFVGPDIEIYGCDINQEMIAFDKTNFQDISFSVIPYTPPTKYSNSFFDFVYALSVFTHIEATFQKQWIEEIHRILNEEGLFLFTTHGSSFISKLLPEEKKILDKNGSFTKQFQKKGHRMMTTYNSKGAFVNMLQPYFEVKEFREGTKEEQDFWVVRKLPTKK